MGARLLKTDTAEHLKPRSQYSEDAVQLAIQGKWDDAVKLNKFIIDSFGADEESQNRLGKSLSELGKLKEAKAAYEAALKINPMNSIAKKNAARINALLHQKEGLKVGGTRVDLNLFVEEMGKTVITIVESPASADISSKVAAGDVAELKVDVTRGQARAATDQVHARRQPLPGRHHVGRRKHGQAHRPRDPPGPALCRQAKLPHAAQARGRVQAVREGEPART